MSWSVLQWTCTSSNVTGGRGGNGLLGQRSWVPHFLLREGPLAVHQQPAPCDVPKLLLFLCVPVLGSEAVTFYLHLES